MREPLFYFRADRLLLFTGAFLLLSQITLAAQNPQEAGKGCVVAAESSQLGDVEDALAPRRLVSLGINESAPSSNMLKMFRNTASLKEFLQADPSSNAAFSNSYLLLVNAKEMPANEIQKSAVISKALAFNVPVLLENYTREEMKALTGLGIEPEGSPVLVQSEPGGGHLRSQ
jgi:hypothetical protein